MYRHDRTLGTSALVFVGILGWVAAASAVPVAIPYVGYLSTTGGAPVDSPVDVEVALYDGGGVSANLLWGPVSFASTPVNSGIFSIVLGTGGDPIADSLLTNPLFLEVTVDSTVLSPRQEILSVPFARLAGDSERLGGVDAGDFIQYGDSADVASVSVDGTLVIGPDGSWLGSPSGLVGP